MSDEELLEKLLQFSDLLTTNNIFISGLRIMGWGILLFLKMIVDSLEGLVNNVLTLTDFFMSAPVQSFLNTIQPVLYILLAFSLAMIGFRLIFNKEKNRADIPMNLFISIMTISLLTFGMGQVNKFTEEAVDVAQVDTESFTTSDRVMKDYITDVAIYDEHQWETPDVKEQHHVSPTNIDKISINETITREFEKANGNQLSSEGKEIIMNKVGIESNGEEGLVELGKSGLFDFLPENYYRWHVDWFTAIVTLGVMAFTMVLISIKIAKLCFELGFNHIVALIMAYVDISTGQRLKMIIKNIGSIFASLIMIFLSLRVYMFYTTFISENLEGIGYLVALIAGSLAVIDGPNIVQKLFGIDAGLKNAWHVAMGGYLASKTLGPPAKKAAGAIASGGTSAVMNTGAGAAGAVAGMAGGKGKSQGSEQNKQSPSPTKSDMNQGKKQQRQEPSPMQSMKGDSQPPKTEKQDTEQGQQSSQSSSLHNGQEQMPNQHRAEQRTIGKYLKDRTKNRLDHNPKVQGAKRTYDLSRNTTENRNSKMKQRERRS
ncbi:pLS20_p028 family conjugation system transmembrane protein [Halobacillus seohaensis]|uniref:PLS20_p028 family conjugation system transmembrane protein n=1 Tax=Halobacillus seohaensis TaxID=447421 RepID=A0ABW2EFU6_9BACI